MVQGHISSGPVPDAHLEAIKTFVTSEDDGQVTCNVPCISITVWKN